MFKVKKSMLIGNTYMRGTLWNHRTDLKQNFSIKFLIVTEKISFVVTF